MGRLRSGRLWRWQPQPARCALSRRRRRQRPFAGRESDRWGLAWSRYDWSDKLGEALDAYGVNLQDEWAVEAFYEAALNENWRLGGNIMRVQPSFESFDDYTQIGFRLRATF
nr:carbohydrate porin [Salipiger sp. CCB-MM3]